MVAERLLIRAVICAAAFSIATVPISAAGGVSEEARTILLKNAELRGKTPALICDFVIEELTERNDGTIEKHTRTEGVLTAKGEARFVRATRWSASGGRIDQDGADASNVGHEWLITKDEIAYRAPNKFNIVTIAEFELEYPEISLAAGYFSFIDETVLDRVWSEAGRKTYWSKLDTCCRAEDRTATASTVGDFVRVSLEPSSDERRGREVEADFDPARDYALIAWRESWNGVDRWSSETEITYSNVGGVEIPTSYSTTTRSDDPKKASTVRTMQLNHIRLTPDVEISLRNFETPELPDPPMHYHYLNGEDGKRWIKMAGGPTVEPGRIARGE